MPNQFDQTLEPRLSKLEIRTTEDDRRYFDTYPLIVDYFKEFVAFDMEENRARIAVLLVYTWMAPAKLDTACWDKFETAQGALRELRTGKLNCDRLERIKSFVGDSLIATSKFLHFFEPARFAIWDRYVAFAAYRYRHHYQYNKLEAYLRYLEDLRSWKMPQFAQDLVVAKIGTMPETRMKEFALFHLGIMEAQDQSARA